MKLSTKQTGDQGEQIAVRYLREQGLEIVETKCRLGRRGEIDVVARDGNVLVFCEVKLRRSDECGEPEFAVTLRKQAQVRKLAEMYLWKKEIEDQECRFDVVAIRKIPNAKIEINYLPNAF